MSAYTQFDGSFTRIAGTDRYTATIDLFWEIGRKGSGLMIRVPALYEHDVSVPALLAWVFNRHDQRFQRAARVHDWLLEDGFDRITAAGAFNDALAADGVSRPKRLAMTLAVAFWKFT